MRFHNFNYSGNKLSDCNTLSARGLRLAHCTQSTAYLAQRFTKQGFVTEVSRVSL